ncbi:MAG: DUF6335 family protein [Blastocatellia bacterium]
MKAKKSKSEKASVLPVLPEPNNSVLDNLVDAGSKQMQREQQEYHSVNPGLAGGDVDADWQGAESSGEETPGGNAPTPHQDEVDEIGRAFGMEIPDNQELRTHDEILAERDAHRWELDKRSTEKSTGEI